MIFVSDKGRLANNIFQYGQLYAWGREHGRKTMSMRFAYKYPDFRISHTRYHNFFMYVIGKLAAKLHLIPTIIFDGEERGQIEMMESHRHVLATGWSVRFPELFQKYKKEIVELFDFAPQVRNNVEKVLESSDKDSLKLGIHIRRGDYKTWCNGRFFFNDEEYISVIQQFCQLHPDKKVDVYVCSNDPQLNQLIFSQRLGNAEVFFPKGTPAEDLCLLSECDYIIGPVSTFTLIASMYHDVPLYWMDDITQPLSLDDFHSFDYQSNHYDEYFKSHNS
jgi:hypothetical protein